MKKVFLIAAFAVAAVLGVSSQNEVQAGLVGTPELLEAPGVACKKKRNNICYTIQTYTGNVSVPGLMTFVVTGL